MILLSILALILLGASVALVLRALVLPDAKVSRRVRDIDVYGFTGNVPAPAADRAKPAFSDLAGSLGDFVARRLRSVRPEDLRTEIMAAGLYRLQPRTLLGYRFLGLVFGALCGVALLGGEGLWMAVLAGGAGGALGWFAPMSVVRSRARRRLGEIDRRLPDLIDLLVVTVEAGLGLGASLRVAATQIEGPLGVELRLALQEQRMGRSLSEALQEMQGRADTPAMRSFTRSITQAESLGVSIGSILRSLAGEMRDRRKAAVQEQAQKAPTKMLFPLVFLIFPALFVVLLAPALFEISRSFS